MSELLKSIREATVLLESLKQARHQKHLNQARRKIKRLILKRWDGQQRATLKVLGPWMHQQALSEADPLSRHALCVCQKPLMRAMLEGTIGDGWNCWRCGRNWDRSLALIESEEKELLRAKLQAAVTAKLEAAAVFGGATTITESTMYESAVEGAMSGAIRNITVDLGIQIARQKGKEFIQNYLDNRAFSQLAKDIDATTKDLIRDGLTREFSEGGTYQDGVKAINDILGDAGRADTIARTELASAYNQAILSSGKEVEGARKQWNTDGPDPCEEICIPNEDQGEIDIDEAFKSGDDAPPGHPRCLCSISIVMPSASK